MSKNVIIACDSTTDLGPELAGKYGVKTLPLGITLGGRLYMDGVDIDPEHIYRHYDETGELPKTSAINVAAFSEFFKECTGAGSSVVMFTISSEMSSTYNNARVAAEEFEDVHVVDTRNLSTGGGALVLYACELAREGRSAADIAAACRELACRLDASFIIDNLEYLYKGGRCSAVAALGSNVLQIKPCIVVRNGRMSVGKKYRGRFPYALKKYVEDSFSELSDLELDRVIITHAGCDEGLIGQCLEQVRAMAEVKEILVTRTGCTISSHCGRNTLGILLIRKSVVS